MRNSISLARLLLVAICLYAGMTSSAPATMGKSTLFGARQASALNDDNVKRCLHLSLNRQDSTLSSMTSVVDVAAGRADFSVVMDAVTVCRLAVTTFPAEPRVVVANYHATEVLYTLLFRSFPSGDAEAFIYLRNLVASGDCSHDMAQLVCIFVGSAYEYGIGTRVDKQEAARFYGSAAHSGSLIARRELTRILSGNTPSTAMEQSTLFGTTHPAALRDDHVKRCLYLSLRRQDTALDRFSSVIDEAMRTFEFSVLMDAVAVCRLALNTFPAEPRVITANYYAVEALYYPLFTKFPVDDTETLSYARDLVAGGDCSSLPSQAACFLLGWAYEYGIGAPADEHQAIKWYRASADTGNLIARRELTRVLSGGTSKPTDDASKTIGDRGNSAAKKAGPLSGSVNTEKDSGRQASTVSGGRMIKPFSDGQASDVPDTDLRVRIGQTSEEVRSAYQIVDAPGQGIDRGGPTSGPKQPLRKHEEGLWFIFANDRLVNIRLEKPFNGHVLGLRVGEPLSKVKSLLGEPVRLFPFASDTAHVYIRSEWSVKVRFDINSSGTIARIFVME